MNHSPGTTGTAAAEVRNPLSVHINADARQVWVMLREPAKVSQWHGWDYDGLAEEIRLIFFAPGVAEAPDHLSLTLEDGDTFLVEPGPDGTVVTVRRGTPEPGSDLADWDADITEGWISFLHQLRFALERHPNTNRHTAFFAGTPADGLSIVDRVGAGSVGEPGDPYTLTMPDGGELTCRVWFRTARQLGLTVAQYAEHGDGLLILAEQPVVEGVRDKPSALVIASTYGLGARALHGVWDSWEAVRRDSYPDADPLVTSDLNRAGKLSS
ncbi:SRPBCC domain-containing protein [Arthrobacter sp. CAN_A1]|uniref:SRPBCC domain-containing protein n=1 Tax=Arthrobacter sp. CAN_A1 TaxID=2787717 RepID=UPI0018CAC54D